MLRSVKIASPLNKGKLCEVHRFLEIYSNCVNYFITRLWSEKRFKGKYLERKYIQRAKGKFALTARLIQCAGKQALEIVKSQQRKSKKQTKNASFKKTGC